MNLLAQHGPCNATSTAAERHSHENDWRGAVAFVVSERTSSLLFCQRCVQGSLSSHTWHAVP
jgi:hypothetical protein